MANESLPTNFRTINLSQGQVAIVDAEDYERVSQFKWSAMRVPTKDFGPRFYAFRVEWLDWRNKKQLKILLHRFILDAPSGVKVDHKNRNPLDCRKCNLRFADNVQNNANRDRKNATGFRGVSRFSETSYTAQVHAAGRKTHVGTFRTAIEAARAYDVAARELHGEFAVLNFPDERF